MAKFPLSQMKPPSIDRSWKSHADFVDLLNHPLRKVRRHPLQQYLRRKKPADNDQLNLDDVNDEDEEIASCEDLQAKYIRDYQ